MAGQSRVVLALLLAVLVLASFTMGSGASPLTGASTWEDEEPQLRHGRSLLGLGLDEGVQDGSYGGYGEPPVRRVALEDAEEDGFLSGGAPSGEYGGY